jgi:hypothetical protein
MKALTEMLWFNPRKCIFKSIVDMVNPEFMKRTLTVLFASAGISFTALPSCGSKGSAPPAEENLVITANPAINGQQESPGVGPNFPLAVTVTSKMPPQGVKVEVAAKEEGPATISFYTDAKTTSSTVSNFVITNTPQAVSCRVTVTVTSVSNATNKATGFYLYSKK